MRNTGNGQPQPRLPGRDCHFDVCYTSPLTLLTENWHTCYFCREERLCQFLFSSRLVVFELGARVDGTVQTGRQTDEQGAYVTVGKRKVA